MTSVIARNQPLHEKHIQLMGNETSRLVKLTYEKQAVLYFTGGNSAPSAGLITTQGITPLGGANWSATVDGLNVTIQFPTWSGRLTLISGDPFET